MKVGLINTEQVFRKKFTAEQFTANNFPREKAGEIQYGELCTMDCYCGELIAVN
jgi:hypothetical protein